MNRKRVRVDRPVFMFGVHVVDAECTEEADVFLYAEEAEYALGGITAEQFARDPHVREVVRGALGGCIREGIFMDFYLWSYRVPRGREPGVEPDGRVVVVDAVEDWDPSRIIK